MSILFTAVSNEHTLVEYFLWENATEILNISISGILFVISREQIYFFLELKWSTIRILFKTDVNMKNATWGCMQIPNETCGKKP